MSSKLDETQSGIVCLFLSFTAFFCRQETFLRLATPFSVEPLTDRHKLVTDPPDCKENDTLEVVAEDDTDKQQYNLASGGCNRDGNE